MFVLRRTDGAFVSDPNTNGTGSSYTDSLRKAKVFKTREAAEGERCVENEMIVPVEELIQGPQ